MNDYYDYRSGVDRPDNFGAVNVLVRKLMTPRQLATEAAVAFGVAVLCGVYLIAQAGDAMWPLIALVAFGALSAYFYTAPPFAFKNRGFGDIQVMFSFALLMVFGAFYVEAKTLSWVPVICSLPIGFLVVDILHINNLRDRLPDRDRRQQTIAIALGEPGSKRLHGRVRDRRIRRDDRFDRGVTASVGALAVFLSLPAAVKLSRAVHAFGPRERRSHDRR